MAACFKLPCLTKKHRRPFQFPEFSWSSILKLKKNLEARHLDPGIFDLLGSKVCRCYGCGQTPLKPGSLILCAQDDLPLTNDKTATKVLYKDGS